MHATVVAASVIIYKTRSKTPEFPDDEVESLVRFSSCGSNSFRETGRRKMKITCLVKNVTSVDQAI